MFIVLGILVLPFLIGAGWLAYQLRPGSDGVAVTLAIGDAKCSENGAKALKVATGDRGTVADALAANDVIDSGLAFKLWATVTSAGPFAEGCYEGLHQALGVRGAASVLDAGPISEEASQEKLFLRPALTIPEIADQVAQQIPGTTAEKFIAAAKPGPTITSPYLPPEATSLEGMLFPDTYFVSAGATEEEIVKKLVNQFNTVGNEVNLAASTRVTPYQAIIVASLIERESKVPEDAPLIAAVIYNRIAQGMQLQIDATLCYARLQATGVGCSDAAPPNNADKAIDSPYNTYRVSGLPPTPISSVTKASLEAALNPADVPYLFYVVADEAGKHAFATTLSEHEANVAAARAKGLL